MKQLGLSIGVVAEPVAQEFDMVWRVRTRLPERFGQRCRVLVRGGMNSVMVEFQSDHKRYVTSRWYVREAR